MLGCRTSSSIVLLLRLQHYVDSQLSLFEASHPNAKGRAAVARDWMRRYTVQYISYIFSVVRLELRVFTRISKVPRLRANCAVSGHRTNRVASCSDNVG
ncbi:hypothetical protein C8R45DRAFT_1005954 [Mycena sanguinolenta]|nr:hypothetical protein C8R45DRAFT_1005954 [Mycena sanguinolenta]